MHADCDFCRIVAGEEPAYRLYEDDRAVAFLDVNPAVQGHTLVVPRDHEAELLGCERRRQTGVLEAIRTVARGLEAALEPDGFSVFYTSGELVGSVEHAHVHLLPRTDGDDVSLSLPRSQLDHDAGTTIASRVRAALD